MPALALDFQYGENFIAVVEPGSLQAAPALGLSHSTANKAFCDGGGHRLGRPLQVVGWRSRG